MSLPPVDIDPASYVLGEHLFVKDNIAVYQSGVSMKDASRQFVVQPESLVLGAVIGRGSSAYVQCATHVPSSKQLALKVLNVFDRAKRYQLITEIQALYDSDCDSLISFLGAYYREGAITIALEYMDCGPLSSVIAKAGALPEPALAAVAFQVLWGLAYLRVEKRLHRDIKPSNILINSNGQVKLSDFGLSAEIKNSIGMAATFVGTCCYMSPERILHKPYAFPADVWSLGLVLVEAALGKYPYPLGATYLEMAETIVDSPEPTLPREGGFSADFAQFIGGCLQKNPDERLPADILLGAPWLARHGVIDLASATSVMKRWLACTPSVVVSEGFGATAACTTPAMALRQMHDSKDDEVIPTAAGSLELL